MIGLTEGSRTPDRRRGQTLRDDGSRFTVSASAGADTLARELLAALQTRLGSNAVAYAEEPERLRGGFFTENQAFRLTGIPAEWDGPLVVRLFPGRAEPDLASREAAVQTALADQDFPAAPVLWFDDAARLDGRRFFVMRRLPGRAAIGGLGPRELARAARTARRLPEITASIQARLHAQDPGALMDRLDARGQGGVHRGIARIESIVDRGATGFFDAMRWLLEHGPTRPDPPVICHGDLWGGNILVDDRGEVTGVLDWSTSTIAEPALDVGATALAFCLVPLPALGPLRSLVERRGRGLYERYLHAYAKQTDADLRARPYYEALRAALELSFVAEWRLAEAEGAHDLPRPSWDTIPDSLVEFFRVRTGVTIGVPPSTS
jgi:aminoglycoside phosphotransferase (APT) family kinase protein